MIAIDLAARVPLTEQIVQGIRRAIAEGAVGPGAELPTVRQLAADLGVNFNTVARAYRILEASGLVHTSRGRGTRVVAAEEPAGREGLGRALSNVRSALADVRLAGVGRRKAQEILAEEIDALWGRTGGS